MCGIFGWALASNRAQNRDLLARLTDGLSHRGPDGAGYLLKDTAGGNFQIGLGHRRLSIIDIAGGVQPMWDDDRTLALIFNGEIYNYIELREELKALGHRFSTQSDTEVLIHAYREWGLDALPKLRGMFAFAIWDESKQRLLLARDPFGKKPLFLAATTGQLIFGSEIEPFTRFPGLDLSLDPDAVDHYLLNRYVPGPATMFRGIRKLQPGCYAVWQKGEIGITRYFTPPSATESPDVSRFEEAIELFEQTFDESVRIRMRSDAPYGAYLSGGIDSSAVVSTMVRNTSGPVRTFSVGFEEAAYSELAYARTIADHFATDHHELTVSARDFFEHWQDAIRHRGAPVSEASDIPILMLSREASKTVKMVLTGEGSDELLGGYPKHRAEPWIEFYQRMVPDPIHRGIVAPAVRALPYGLRRIKILAAAASEREFVDRARIWFGGTSIGERDALAGGMRASAPPDAFPFSSNADSPLRRTLFFDQTSWLPDNLLERGDRMMMAGSIEGRMPFMDTELARVVARFPDRFLIDRPGGKAVLRAVMDNRLPAEIVKRKKIGFRVPFNEWFRTSHSNLVRELLTSQTSQVARMLDGAQLRRLVDDHMQSRQNNERILWSLMNLEMFLQLFKPANIEDAFFKAA